MSSDLERVQEDLRTFTAKVLDAVEDLDEHPGQALMTLTHLGLCLAQHAQELTRNVYMAETTDARSFLSTETGLYNAVGEAVALDAGRLPILDTARV